MFNRFKILKYFAQLKPESKTVSQMAQKIDAMKKSMNQSSPKFFSIFFILSTIPSFYFVDKIMNTQYSDQQLLQCSNASIKYINIKNILFLACSLGLDRLGFYSPTSQFTVKKISLKKTKYFALFASICALALPPSDNKYIVFPTFFSDLTVMGLQAQLCNSGVIPFWFFSYRHFIRFFDFIILGINFFALKRLRKRRESHPHQFIENN